MSPNILVWWQLRAVGEAAQTKRSILAGNHPYATRLMNSSFARPTRTSTSSASSASHCRCAPSVPGPRDDILPADDTTRCHGTGGLASEERNLSAVTTSRSRYGSTCQWEITLHELYRGKWTKGMGRVGLLTLSDVS